LRYTEGQGTRASPSTSHYPVPVTNPGGVASEHLPELFAGMNPTADTKTAGSCSASIVPGNAYYVSIVSLWQDADFCHCHAVIGEIYLAVVGPSLLGMQRA